MLPVAGPKFFLDSEVLLNISGNVTKQHLLLVLYCPVWLPKTLLNALSV